MAKQGFNVVDTDYGYIKTIRDERLEERVWDEEKITKVLEKYQNSHLFISGCYSNQGKFYDSFDHIVLLKAELDIMYYRIKSRTNNNYGKSPEEWAEILENYKNIQPLLEKSSDIIIDTTHIDIDEVCMRLKALL